MLKPTGASVQAGMPLVFIEPSDDSDGFVPDIAAPAGLCERAVHASSADGVSDCEISPV